MAFRRFRRRFPSRSRFPRRNPYDVQRFHLCRLANQIGPGSCSDGGTTNALTLIAPDAQVAAATGAIINAARLAGVDKALTLGGMRFWLDWTFSSATLPAAAKDIMFQMNVMVWIAKVPVDPELRFPSYLPDPFAAAIQSDMQYDFLWTRQFLIPIAVSANASQPLFIMNSQGNAAALYTTQGYVLTSGSGPQPVLPYRVKTKRRLLETDVLMFGVSGFHTIADQNALVPLIIDLHGQVAVKRSR